MVHYSNPERVKDRVGGNASKQLNAAEIDQAQDFSDLFIDLKTGRSWVGTTDVNGDFVSTGNEKFGDKIGSIAELVAGLYLRYDFNEQEMKSDKEYILAVDMAMEIKNYYGNLGLLGTTLAVEFVAHQTNPLNPSAKIISGVRINRSGFSEHTVE